MSRFIHYFFQITLIMFFSIIRYLKTFETRTLGPCDKHYIVWGSHFRYHRQDFLPKWRLCKHLHLPRPAVEVGTRWRGRSRDSKRRVNIENYRKDISSTSFIHFKSINQWRIKRGLLKPPFNILFSWIILNKIR